MVITYDEAPAAILIGPMGAGKTTAGAALAKMLGTALLDTDEMVVHRCGCSIPELFRARGEKYFRDLEHVVVTSALAEHRGVVALGGGSILHAETQAALRGHRVVFLDLTVDAASRRAGFDQNRPLLAANPRESWLRLMGERRAIYEDLAELTINTAPLTPEEVAEQIADYFVLRPVGSPDAVAPA